MTGLFDLSAILIAGAITVVVRIESGERYAWAAVAVVTVLSLVFLPDKLLALGYFAVAGAYPLLCRFLPQRGAAMWITRALIGAALSALYFVLIKFVFVGSYDLGERYLYPFLFVGGVVLFILWDRFIPLFSRFYGSRIRPALRRRKK